MKRVTWIGLFVLASACGETEGTDAGSDAGRSEDGGGTDAGTDTGPPDAGTDAGPPVDAGPRTLVPVCYPTCATPGDCDLGTPGFGPANFSCDDGYCVHLGCIEDDDCPGGGARVCHSFDGEVPRCVRVCFAPADCVVGGTPSTDEDNFECAGGLCRSTGCNGDVECRNSFGPDWACREGVVNVFGLRDDVPTCAPTCATPADCIIGTFAFLDDDNFECVDGICRYTGCLSDTECTEAEPSVCR